MIEYQLPHTRFDQISGPKHSIYLNKKLSTKLLAQAANENTSFVFTKTADGCVFLKFDFGSECPGKF